MRYQPYGGAGQLPTECCEFAVVDTEAGIEICRVWKEADARRIARLLSDEGLPTAADVRGIMNE